MSILINMEMPENCFECPCLRHDSIDGMSAYQCNIMLQDGIGDGRPEWCPLVEVPKHGRLIDADALTGKAYMDGKLMCVEMDDIEEAPTIIEAEE